MKRHILYILPMALGLVMTSCLDFDKPGDEFTSQQEIVDDTVRVGSPTSIVDSIYARTEAGFAKAQTNLTTQLKQMKGGQYAIRGGKNGDYPGSHAYQRQYTFGPDLYAQYATIPHHDFMYGEMTSSYYLSLDFNPGPNSSYIIVKNYMTPLLNADDVDSIPEIKAITLLMHDVAAQEVADLYGPFPYTAYLHNQTESPFHYDPLDSIYYQIEKNIDAEVKCFKAFATRPAWYQKKVQSLLDEYPTMTNDQETGRQGFETWIKFANSLKLRMAMHMVKVDPARAKTWAEEAVADGVVESYEDEISFRPLTIGFTHPLQEISHTWGDTRLSASFGSLLQSLNHPFLGYLFTKNTGILHNTSTGEALAKDSEYIGIREGAHTGVGQAYANNEYIGFSEYAQDEFTQNAPLYIFKLSEVEFLRAEGSLRGWEMGGSAQHWYEEGIRHADFADRMIVSDEGSPYQDGLENYMSQESASDYTWVDPMGIQTSMPSVTKIGVKWNDGDSQETKLEKIITQKYISLWPNSMEAWGDLRRTRYPKLFPVLNAQDGDGSLFDGDLIRRMPWAPQDDATKEDVNTSGVPALGGFDEQATRLWWDVDAPNF